MPVKAARNDRGRIGDCALSFTRDEDDIQEVLANARPLLAWAEQASDETDLRERISCMEEQAARNARREFVPETPEAFLNDVRDAWAFVTGNDS